METSALFSFLPAEDDEKNVYATRPCFSSRGCPIRCSCPDDVQSCLLDPPPSLGLPPSLSPSPSLVWPFDREESISQERHVSKVRESDPPLLSLQKGVRARRTVWTERWREAGSDRARSPRREEGGSEGDLI